MMVHWMAQVLSEDYGDEHLVILLDPGEVPVELGELQGSLAALTRIYERHHSSETIGVAPAKLYVTRVSSGSIVLEIVPMLAMLGTPIEFMDAINIIRDFSRWIGTHIRAVADATGGFLSREDASDLETFVKPLTGRKSAALGVTHARFRKTEKGQKGEREIVVEYKFNESEINRAAVNLQKVAEIANAETLQVGSSTRTKTVREALMVFQQADKGTTGKERGRTGDRVIISDLTDQPLPVYFPKEAAAIKRRILDQTENPFAKGYIVDAIVQYGGDDTPKVYSVIELHDIVDID